VFATKPERLTVEHGVSGFCNGRHSALDDWLRDRALASEGLSARTYVVCDSTAPTRVIGYYAIATTREQRAALPNAKLRRGMPDEVPLFLIARLAVDQAFRGHGLGSNVLADAIRRCLSAAEIVGARGIASHAIDDDAVTFYLKHDFFRSPLGERVMILPIELARALMDKITK
jgi:GNAT superfamily N-acetyltransferase